MWVYEGSNYADALICVLLSYVDKRRSGGPMSYPVSATEVPKDLSSQRTTPSNRLR